MATGRDEEVLDAGRAEADAVARTIGELDGIRRRVINVVGHAMRTPVTTIAGMARALATAEDDATRAMLIDGLSRNARRVELLLDDLLLAAGVDTALPVGEAAPASVQEAFRSAWTALDGPGELPMLGADVAAMVRSGVLERIAEILLDNALKYGHGQVSVASEATPSGVHIEVESVGDAPKDEELEQAFELLYRGEHAVTTSSGLGIGLAVARGLARSEGGDVNLQRRGAAIVATVDLLT